MSSSVLSQQNHSFHTMDDNRNTAIRPDNFSDTSSNSIPTTPALSKEHDLMKKDNNSTMFISEDVDPYATAEHVAAWLPLDDPPKDNASNHDILIDAIPPLPAKATRLPAPATIWKTWESPTLLPWGNDSIWMSSNKPRRFSTSLPPPLLSSMGTSATPTMITPKRRTSVTTLSSSSMPYHRRSSFPDTVLSTTDQSKKDYWQSLVSGDLDRPLYTKTDAASRRYSSPSCAATASSSSMCHQDPPLSPELMQRIDDYFSSTPSMSNRMNAGSLAASMSSMTASEVQNMGKGVPLLELLHDDTVTLFTVELAPGRQDIYYMQHDGNDDNEVKEGDLVIVEADRGQDMGQVKGVFAKTTTKKKNDDDDDDDEEEEDDNSSSSTTTCVRRLYRLATREEIATLPTKAQDEAKALLVCQSKIKERELPMQVLRAEYQWDRRKLTFHFTAEERVDFRELVRELFKLYKTRIWMCAINNKHHHHSSYSS